MSIFRKFFSWLSRQMIGDKPGITRDDLYMTDAELEALRSWHTQHARR